jgi:signal transduction histidine kinase
MNTSPLFSKAPERFPAGAVEVFTEAESKEAVLKAGALQNAILNSANFSSIATDASGVIQIFNIGAERMLGYAAAEVSNKITPADISDPQELIARAKALSLELATTITPGFEALVFKASRGIEDIYELTYIRKDGSRFPAIVSVTALRDKRGRIIGYLLIGTDNSARKRAEEALIKAAALQSAIFNSANFSCIATDAKGVIQIFNVGAERMLGYTTAEVVNQITPAGLHDPREVIERAAALSLEFATPIAPGFEALAFKASRGIEDIYELTKIRKDGSRFPAVVSVTALRDAQGAIIGYLLIGTDNTARRKAEDAVRQLHAELEERVIQRTAELEAANKELEAFSYSVSHDLRTPLRAVDGFSQAVLKDYGPQLPEEGRRYLQTIRKGAQRMGALIDDLLAFARLNRQELSKRAIDTGSLVRGALDELGYPWPDRAVEIVMGNLPASSGDPALLKQVWLNLLSNALKYTRKRGKAVVEIGCMKTHDADTFFVRDNGTGFDLRYANKLFGVFQRLHLAEDYEGTGVGLAIVQRIVHRHGGRVWADAAVDRGATFYFTLEKENTS